MVVCQGIVLPEFSSLIEQAEEEYVEGIAVVTALEQLFLEASCSGNVYEHKHDTFTRQAAQEDRQATRCCTSVGRINLSESIYHSFCSRGVISVE